MTHIKYIKIAILSSTIIFTFSCNNNTSTDNNVQVPKPIADQIITDSTNAKNAIEEEASTTVATLNAVQLKTIDLQYGNIENKQLTAVIKANGLLIVPNTSKANATSLYGGVVRSMNVHEGDFVSKGKVLATISNPQFLQLQEEFLQLKSKNNLGNAEGASVVSNPQYAGLQDELASIAPRIKMAQLEVVRQQELTDGNAGALKNLQQAKTDVSVLQARQSVLLSQKNVFTKTTTNSNSTRLKSIEAQLRLMGLNPANIGTNNLTSSIYVTSPISGTISKVMAKIGSYVDVQSPVAEIVNNSQLHLELFVFEKDLPLLKIGQSIHFALTNNAVKEYDATIYSIGSAFENESKTISVHCELEGNKQGLIDGMNISALVSLNNTTTPAVSNDAIVESEGKYFVFVKNDNAKTDSTTDAHFTKVEVLKGVSNLGYTAVTFVNEVPANAKIVTKGAYYINAKLVNVEVE